MARDISRELRDEIARRAGYRCEYCLIHERDAGFKHQIDHIISRKHGGSSVPDNLAYTCVVCNRTKGSDIAALDPETNEAIRLFHPRRDRWTDHFRLQGERIEPISTIGRGMIQLLKLNAAERLAERRLLQRLGAYPLG